MHVRRVLWWCWQWIFTACGKLSSFFQWPSLRSTKIFFPAIFINSEVKFCSLSPAQRHLISAECSKEAKEILIVGSFWRLLIWAWWFTGRILNDSAGHCKVRFHRVEPETLERKRSNSGVLNDSRPMVLEEIHLLFYMKKEDRYFPKTLFGLSSLSGWWHIFHGSSRNIEKL